MSGQGALYVGAKTTPKLTCADSLVRLQTQKSNPPRSPLLSRHKRVSGRGALYVAAKTTPKLTCVDSLVVGSRKDVYVQEFPAPEDNEPDNEPADIQPSTLNDHRLHSTTAIDSSAPNSSPSHSLTHSMPMEKSSQEDSCCTSLSRGGGGSSSEPLRFVFFFECFGDDDAILSLFCSFFYCMSEASSNSQWNIISIHFNGYPQ